MLRWQSHLDNPGLRKAADKFHKSLARLGSSRTVVTRPLVREEAAARPVEDEGCHSMTCV